MRQLLVCALALLPILGPGSSAAQTAVPKPYKLSDTSRFETGCFTICECPILSQPLQGTFLLQPLAPHPLFDEYRVLDIRWTVPGAQPSLSITGSGTYRLGGEVAVQHQMTLDLSIAGGPVQHFDSGLVGTTNDRFPRIEIRVPLHGDSACVDTVLVVHAAPAAPTATGVEPAPEPAISLRAVHANPFRDRAELVLRVARLGTVTIEILNVHGRIVRRWTWEAAATGEHPLVWDGRDGSGAESASGVYLVRARQLDRVAMARVLRIR